MKALIDPVFTPEENLQKTMCQCGVVEFLHV